MIKVNYTEPDGPHGPTLRLEAGGHAGYAPAGQDIVCAGASTLMQALISLLAGEENVRSDAWDEPEGPRLVVTAPAPCPPWVEGAFELAKTGFALLAERYPDNLRFADLSDRGGQAMMDLQLFAEGEAAMMDSILPRQTAAGDRLFLGVSATRADSVAAIPFLAPEQEALLEYEIARIVLSAVSEERPAVGVISPLKVLGVKTDLSRIRQSPSSAPVRMEPAWYTMSELSRNYDLRELAEDVPAIPADIKALLIINPVKLSPRTLYAIDQFLLRGGKAAVFLDPRSFYAALKSRTDYSLLDKLESDLQPLLPAWGIAWNPAMMVADMVSAYRKTLPDRMVTNPMALNLAPARITRANPLFANLNEISMYFTGFFHIVPREGVEYETLLTSSPESQIVSSLLGNRPELVIKNFKSADREYPLAVRLRGRLNTAYPGGAPDRSALPAGHAHLAKGVREAEIYLFSDSDMLFNDVCVTAYSDAFGTRSYRRSNDNVAMLQNVMESLTGSRMLASIRNRVPMSRPLTKINTLKAEAELKYKNRILE